MKRSGRRRQLMLPLGSRPYARARIREDAGHPALNGFADFFPDGDGVLMLTELWGLPYDPAPCASNLCAMHIHAGGSCSGDMDMSFQSAGGHYNPKNCPHPAHAGDLSPLFSNRGYAFMAFYTERFTVREIVGKTVIIHAQRDDFASQPAGDSGKRIGCGVIRQAR